MEPRSVKGERIGAAVIDYVIYNIITSFIAVISLIFVDMDSIANSIFLGNQINLGTEFITYTLVISIISLFIGMILYAFIPYANNGKTLGKSLVRIKAVTEDFGENPSLKAHLLRAIMLWGAYIQTPLVVIGYFSFWGFTISNSLVSVGSFVVVLVSFIMILSNDKGLHDMISSTRVVHVDYNPNKDFVEAATRVKDWADIESEDEADPFDVDPDKYKEKKKDDDFDW